jgi:hypothetical protein
MTKDELVNNPEIPVLRLRYNAIALLLTGVRWDSHCKGYITAKKLGVYDREGKLQFAGYYDPWARFQLKSVWFPIDYIDLRPAFEGDWR